MNYPPRGWSSDSKTIFRLLAVLTSLTVSHMATNRAWAVGGPENVLLVANPRSPDSLCIANHYAALRHIPPNNLLLLDWDPKQENTDVNTFREKILLPVLRAAKQPIPGRQILGRQIDCVVYSSDFPWGIRIDDDIQRFKAVLEKKEAGKEEQPAAKSPPWITWVTPVASINGLTYLWEPVVAGISMSTRNATGTLAPEYRNRRRNRPWGSPVSRPTAPMARREPVRDATTCCR